MYFGAHSQSRRQIHPQYLRGRVSPLSVVEEPTFRIIYHHKFSAGAPVWSSVRNDTDLAQAPTLLLGHVLCGILSPILFSPQLHGTSLTLLLCRADVKEDFRQVFVAPGGESAFGERRAGRARDFWSLFPPL